MKREHVRDYIRNHFFPSLVTLLNGLCAVAEGNICPVREHVHGHPVLPSEIVVEVTKVFYDQDDVTHPLYGYEVSTGSFVQWAKRDSNF